MMREWEGIPVNFVNPKGTSKLCPVCAKRLQEDRENRRKMWCGNCKRLMNRDVVASMNIAYRGGLVFIHPKGVASEATSELFPRMQEPKPSNYDDLVILIVDAAKLFLQPKR